MSIINFGLFYLTIPDTVNQLLILSVPVNKIKYIMRPTLITRKFTTVNMTANNKSHIRCNSTLLIGQCQVREATCWNK